MIHIIPHTSRGGADYGWLQTNYFFSFADYYNPTRMGFGALRVINDDIIAGGGGFDTHSHRDMEIITIPLSGSLSHKDSMGNGSTVSAGEVQVMSAGTGVAHSEFNASQTEATSLFQIWIYPHTKGVEPRYMEDKVLQTQNEWSLLVGPKGDVEHLWIHQDAWIYRGKFQEGAVVFPRILDEGYGLFFMVIEGKMTLDGNVLSSRDAAEIREVLPDSIQVKEQSDLLLIYVPL